MATLEELGSPAWAELSRRQAAAMQIPDLIMNDLAKFCHVTEPDVSNDPYELARRAGRRDVFMRLAAYRGLTVEELFRRFGGVATQTNRSVNNG